MKLFQLQESISLLPYDGDSRYYGPILADVECRHFFSALFNHIAWRNDEAVIFGRHIITKRKVAWYGERDYAYTYSNTTKNALPWTPELTELKEIVERISGKRYNSCLLNLYHDGDEGMAWHSDDEKALEKNSPIASLSLGAERRFSFRHKQTRETLSLMLENGSLLVMQGSTQDRWLHALPKMARVHEPRINLTFRVMERQE